MSRIVLLAVLIASLLSRNVAYAQTDSVAQQVSVELSKAKHLDFSGIEVLGRTGTSILPELKIRASDKAPLVRDAVLKAAAEIHSPDSEGMVICFVADKEDFVARDAIMKLDVGYDRPYLLNMGGLALKNNLIRHVSQDTAYAPGLLLLGYYSGDVATADFLAKIRAVYPAAKTQVKDGQSGDLYICVDLALAELGSSADVRWISHNIQFETPDNLLFVLSALKYVNNRQVLRATVELLKDRRETRQTTGVLVQVPAGQAPSPNNPRLRVCDAALIALTKKLAVHTGIADVDAYVDATHGIEPNRNFSEDELAQSYARLSNLLTAQDSHISPVTTP